MRRPAHRLLPSLVVLALVFGPAIDPALSQSESRLPKSVQFSEQLSGNRVTLETPGGRPVSVYRPVADSHSGDLEHSILLTHLRRDQVEGVRPFAARASVLAPGTDEATIELMMDPPAFWDAWWNGRFDYYGQQVTRLPTQPLEISRWVNEGDLLEIGNLSIEVMATPGVTREGVSFVVESGGKTIIFSGNLILAGGKVPDLYSFQDAIPEAKVGAYHGYGGRFGSWIESLEKLASRQPDLIVPSQGPVIENPARCLEAGIEQVRKIYANYLSTNALHWYFGEERMRRCADKVLGTRAPMESMPLARHVELPAWIQHMGTTKLLVSESRAGFVLDVGGTRSLDMLKKAVADGLISKIEGIWVTHRHNDHTQSVRDAQETFDCPVYAVAEVAAALTDPGAHFSPGLSANAVKAVTVMSDRATMTWREFDFIFRFFPGQMHDHGALLVSPDDTTMKPVFFIGDSFSPSGIDDYCLMNRNLMREDSGYLKCFRILREELPEDTSLVNQHIPHLFGFNARELDHLESRYRERIRLVSDFTPWDDPNYAVDEQWAWLFPYGQELKRNSRFSLQLKIMNHSPGERTFTATTHLPDGFKPADQAVTEVTIPPRETGEITIEATVSESAPSGVSVITLSLASEGLDLPHWCEALVKISD